MVASLLAAATVTKSTFRPVPAESQQGIQACLPGIARPYCPWSDDVASLLGQSSPRAGSQAKYDKVRFPPCSTLSPRNQGRQTGPGLSLSGPADDVPSLARAVESGDLVL